MSSNQPEPLPAALVNIEAEAALLGLMMTDNRIIDSVADNLAVGDFAEPTFGDICSAIFREASLGRAPNPVTLRPYFEDHEGLRQLGGPGYLAKLTGNAAMHLLEWRDMARHIRSLAARRRLVAGLAETMRLASDPACSTDQLLTATDAAIAAATADDDGLHQLTGAKCIDEVLDGFGAEMPGVTCRTIPSLDEALGPLRPKQLIIGAGRPGMGKTALAISYAIGAARAGHGVLFVSLEMSSTELGERMAADLCFDGRKGVPYAAIRDRRASGDDLRSIGRARGTLAELPLHVIDAPSLTIGRLDMIVRRYKRRLAAKGQSLDLVIVDYLQLMQPDQRRSSNYEAVSEVSRGLKAIAKGHRVAVFALAQLSREAEKRPDKRPQMSDLRDSGQIEQDADVVLLLYRLEYYLRQAEPAHDDSERSTWEASLEQALGDIEFIVAKRRNGTSGVRRGEFHAQYQAVRG